MTNENAIREANTAFGEIAEVSQVGEVFTVESIKHGRYSGSSWEDCFDAYYNSEGFRSPVYFKMSPSFAPIP